MKILSWNIRQGGGERRKDIVARIVDHKPDVIVLLEYRTKGSETLVEDLRSKGWTHFESSLPNKNPNGVCVISKTPLLRRDHPSSDPEIQKLWVEVEVEGTGLHLSAIHVPGEDNRNRKLSRERKGRFWDCLLKLCGSESKMIIGDFNTGLHRKDEVGKTFVCAEHFKRLSDEHHWTDLWRGRNEETEYTWYSKRRGGAQNKGFRLDHAFASPGLMSQIGDLYQCSYSHEERKKAVSDHSVLLVEITLPATMLTVSRGLGISMSEPLTDIEERLP